jgi:hypothetical protein
MPMHNPPHPGEFIEAVVDGLAAVAHDISTLPAMAGIRPEWSGCIDF